MAIYHVCPECIYSPRIRRRFSSTAPPPRSLFTSSPTIIIDREAESLCPGCEFTHISRSIPSPAKLSITISKNSRVGLPRTWALTFAAVSRAVTKGPIRKVKRQRTQKSKYACYSPGPRESAPSALRKYDALCIAKSVAVLCCLSFPHAVLSLGLSPVKIRNAMFICSYVSLSGARPITTESWL